MGFSTVSVSLINQCSMSMSSASEPESSLITFTGPDSIIFSASSSRFTATQIPANGLVQGAVTMSVKDCGGGGGIIFNIFVKGGGGDYSREAINRGMPIIRGNMVVCFCELSAASE